MSKRHLLLILLALILTACGSISGGSLGTPTPAMVPSPTSCPSAIPVASPTMTTTATATAVSTPTRTPTPAPTSTPGPEARYRRLIVVDQDEQWLYVYENGAQIRSMPCSTGKAGEETHTPAWEGKVGYYVGTFFSFGVYADEGWYLFHHYGGMLIHSAPYLIKDGAKVYQDLDALGVRPTSHGCIRLPPAEAKWLTEWDPKGAYMMITPPPFTE